MRHRRWSMVTCMMGGRDISTSARNQTYDYDIVHDTWSSCLNLPYGVNVAGAAVLGGQVWVIGGGNPFLTLDGSSSTAESNAPQAIATTLIFDPGTNSWTAGPALNVPRPSSGRPASVTWQWPLVDMMAPLPPMQPKSRSTCPGGAL